MKQVGKNLEAPPSVQRLVRILWLDCFVCSSVRFTGFSVSLHICASLPETEAGDLRRVCALQITLFFVIFGIYFIYFHQAKNSNKTPQSIL